MSTLLSTISNTKIKVRWEEPYVSEALNKVVGSLESGVQFGFEPTPGGGLSLSLGVSSVTSTSALLYRNTLTGLSSLYLETSAVTLDLTAHATTTVYIGVTVSYAVTSVTTGEIRAYTQAEYDAGLGSVVVVCGVTVPAAVITQGDIMKGNTSFRWKERLYDDSKDMVNAAAPAQLKPAMLWANNEGPVTSGSDNVYMDYVVEADSKDPKVVKAYHNSGTGGRTIRYAVVGAKEAEPLYVRFRVKTSVLTSSGVGVRTKFLDDTGAQFSTVTTDPIGAVAADTRAWEYHEVSLVCPAGTSFVEVSLNAASVSAGTVFFDDVFITSPTLGRYGSPAAKAETFLAAMFYGHADVAASGLISMMDGGGQFRVQAYDTRMDLFGNEGVRIENTSASHDTHIESARDVVVHADDDLDIQGAQNVLMTANLGNLSLAGASYLSLASALGSVQMQGGYGSSGVSVSQFGNLSMDGDLVIDGTMDRVVLTTPVEVEVYRRFIGGGTGGLGGPNYDGLVYVIGVAPTTASSSVVHSGSGQAVPGYGTASAAPWVQGASGSTMFFQVPVSAGLEITNIKIHSNGGSGTDYASYEVDVYHHELKSVAVDPSVDEGLKWIGQFAYTSQSSLSVVTPGWIKSLSTVAGWSDFKAEGPLLIAIKQTLVGAATLNGHAGVFGIGVKYRITSLSELGAAIG